MLTAGSFLVAPTAYAAGSTLTVSPPSTFANPARKVFLTEKAENRAEKIGSVLLASHFDQKFAEIQRLLNALGYDAGEANGLDGPRSREAIKTFQVDQGQEATGFLSHKQFALLNELYEVSFGSHDEGSDINETGGPGEPSNVENTTNETSEFANAYQVRERIISDNDIVVEGISGLIHPTLLSVVVKPNVLNETLYGSVPVIGCSNDPFLVYGYYNVGQHVWTLLKIERQSQRVVEVRLSAGFSPKKHQQDTAWYDLFESNGDILKALKEAARIQLESFQELFPYQGCSSFEELDQLFTQDEALYNISTYRAELPEQPKEVVGEMATAIAELFNLKDKNVLQNVSLVPEVLGYRYLSVFSSRKNPNLVFVQGWNEDGGGLQLSVQSHGLLYEIE